jgi:hypothetical protein
MECNNKNKQILQSEHYKQYILKKENILPLVKVVMQELEVPKLIQTSPQTDSDSKPPIKHYSHVSSQIILYMFSAATRFPFDLAIQTHINHHTDLHKLHAH